ncbi:MAG TPA: bifunctional DNA primase/polymerase [Pseudonocardiaceae bacterium]|jgi:hypothetical protein|nr:bifunctional DNA primase/polymerase [Pseudonocardiaceae bacterium]
MDTDPFLTAALSAAARGWPVVPLKPGTKRPAFHGYDRCPRTGPCTDGHQGWEQRAMLDPHEIRWYWGSRRYAGCNVGIAVGRARLVGVDLDIRKPGDAPPFAPWNQPGVCTGEDVFILLSQQAGELPPVDTYTVRTASGGSHLYYQAPENIALRNTSGSEAGAGLGWKIDTRAGGGQLVAAGSIVDGRPYTAVMDVDPIPLPAWLCERLKAATPAPASPSQPVSIRNRTGFVDSAVRATVAKVRATKVNRNAALWGAAVSLGQLVGGGQLTEREHAEALADAASGHIAVGAYTARQAAQTIASGLRKGIQQPRQVAA